jgi:D-alanyl-D-alanine carboxypeptidase (penicillin-binding protein 5/6)
MRKVAVIIILIVSGLALPVYAIAGRNIYRHHVTTVQATTLSYDATTTPVRVAAASDNLFDPSVSAYAIDTTTMTPLYAQNETTHRAIASITKLMTMIIVLADHKTSNSVTVGQLPAYQPADETLGLTKGQVFTVGALAKAALIPSDNDAADALAIYDAGSQKAFIAKMNAELVQWGITGAHFNSTEGLTDSDNYASAVALAKIGKLALTNPTIAADVRLASATISDASGQSYNLVTSDDLLATGQFYGIKTGYTDAAGECFIGLAHVNGHDVITVVLHSSDRFGDTLRLLNWIQGAWQWQ